MKKVIFNVKPSNRMRDGFIRSFPQATFYGSATLGSKSKSYLLPLDVYEANKEKLKFYGSKAKYQPFLSEYYMKLKQQLRKSNKDLNLLRQIKENARTQILSLSKQFPNGIMLYEGKRDFEEFDDWKDENGATDFELITKNGTDNCYLVGLINGLVSYYNEDTSMFCECTLDRIVWDNYPYILNALLTKAREMQIQESKKAKRQKAYQIAIDIKSMLVDMAINDKLPMDLNDLDASKIAKLL